MTDERKQYGLRYVGERFQNARLPLEVLSDLPAFRDLIAAVAKHQFRKRNADRERVPRGFDRSISFTLVGIEDGSAVPKFELETEVAQQSLPTIGNQIGSMVDEAFNEVASLIDNASRDIYPDVVPPDIIRAWTKFGSSIQGAERIEFEGSLGLDGNVVSFTHERRKRLLTRMRETYTIEIEDVGKLTGIDVKRNTIQIESDTYGELKLELNGTGIFAQDFDGFTGSEVEFTISAALDANDELKAIESISTADLVSPYDQHVVRCIKRLRELSELEPGWLGQGEGDQVGHLVGALAKQFVFARDQYANLFHLYPMEEGGISIEFDIEDWSFAVEIQSDGTLEIDGSSSNGDAFEEQSFDQIDSDFFAAFDKMVGVENVED
jgi:hypothetical protein